MHASPFLTALLLAAGSTPLLAAHGDHAGPAPLPGPRSDQPPAWTQFPLLLVGGSRGSTTARPVGIVADEVEIVGPRAQAPTRRQPLAAGTARLEPASPGTGNYHWLQARSESPFAVTVASSIWYVSNPGPAPTALLEKVKNELEIVPRPLPREHASYRESEKWRFTVRFWGKPLPGQSLFLETEHGSRSRFVTDANGEATVLFPRDIPVTTDGTSSPRQSAFVLATEKTMGDRRYLTAFNATYSPDADRNRNLAWGAAFGILGMAAAAPLLRRGPIRQAASGDRDHA